MERITKFRVGVFLALVALMLVFFGLRAYDVQVVNATVSDNSIGTYTYTTPVSAARGQILDRSGNILVSNRASYNLIINSYVLYNSDNPNESLRQLANLCHSLGLEYAEHLPVSLQKPYEYTLESYSESWQSYSLPQRARSPLSQCAAKMAAFLVSAARSASGPYHGRAAIYCGRAAARPSRGGSAGRLAPPGKRRDAASPRGGRNGRNAQSV